MKTYFMALLVLAIAFLATVLAIPTMPSGAAKGDPEENIRYRRSPDPAPTKGKGGYSKGGGGGGYCCGGGGGGYSKGKGHHG